MKKLKLVLGMFSAVVASSGLAGNTCTWTAGAGNGSWKMADNWDTKPVSWNGDTVVLSAQNGVTSLTNDISAGFVLYSIQVVGDTPVTLTGDRLTINNQTTWLTTETPFTCDVEIRPNQSGSYQWISLGDSATFLKPITLNKDNITLRIKTTAGNGSEIIFNAPLVSTASGTQFAFVPKAGDSMWINASISAPTVSTHCNQVDNDVSEIHVSAPMDYSLLHVENRILICEENNVLCSTGKVEWAGYNWNGRLNLNGHDQMTGPLGGDSNYGNNNCRVLESVNPATLTIAGKVSDTTYAIVRGAVSICLNAPSSDVVQTFGKREHDTTGDLDIARGTLKIAEGAKWTNVKRLHVRGEGAAFEVDTANGVVSPLPSLHHLRVGTGGVVRIPAGVTINTHLFYFGNTSFAVGKYSGVAAEGVTQTDAIDGAGVVEVVAPSSDYVFWTGGANDGNWSSPGNWSGGTPSSSKPVKIAPEAYAETITIGAGDTLPSALTIDGSLATVRVLVDGSFEWNPTAVTVNRGGVLEIEAEASIKTTAGAWTVNEGEILVSGGTLDVNSFTGTFKVKGTDQQEGLLRMTSGVISHKPGNWNDSTKMQIQGYGKLLASGGVLRANTAANGHTSIINVGGQMEFSGTAKYEGVETYSEAFSFRVGGTSFGGASSLANKGPIGKLTILAEDGKTNIVAFTEHAKLSGTPLDATTISADGNGLAVLDINSDASFDGSFGHRIIVGVDDKRGELIVRNGYNATGYRGLIVGGAGGKASDKGDSRVSAFGGFGLFRMTGGGMSIGVRNKKVEEGFFPGWSVGEGGQTLAEGKDIFAGRAEISGGCLTNLGFTVVGGAHSSGIVDQVGGEVCLQGGDNCPFLLGLAGGTGSYVLGGGRLELNQDVFVGGAFTNVIRGSDMLVAAYPYPVNDHTAVGTLTVTGGTFVSSKQIMLGANGTGTINVRGSGAAISCASLVLSNTVELATSSTLNFTADANGFTPIEVAGKVVNTSGTTITVDLTEAPASQNSYKLIGYTVWEGPVPACTFVGSADSNFYLTVRRSGLYVRKLQGSCVIIH